MLGSPIRGPNRTGSGPIQSGLSNLEIKDRVVRFYIGWDRTGPDHYAAYSILNIYRIENMIESIIRDIDIKILINIYIYKL